MIPAAIALVLPLAFRALPADIKPLTLFQRAGRSPWIIYGETVRGDHRFAEIKVVEVIKGSYSRESFRIIFKLENFLRDSWEEKMGFAAGERAVFFLKRYETDREDGKLDDWMKAEDLFAQAFGAQGKFPLPEEGSAAYLEALREFARVGAITDPAARDDAVLNFIRSSNPHLLDAGLERIIEERLAGPGQVPELLRLSDSPRDSVRLNALQSLGQVAEDLHAAGRKLENHADVVDLLKAKAIGDGGDIYRAEAVRVVAALSGNEERPFLERLAKEDRSQLVRYEAGRAVLALGPR